MAEAKAIFDPSEEELDAWMRAEVEGERREIERLQRAEAARLAAIAARRR